MEAFHLETRKRVCNVVIDPRDMHCSKIKVIRGAECSVPLQVHYPRNFGSTGMMTSTTP